jgi:hypothetical protein
MTVDRVAGERTEPSELGATVDIGRAEPSELGSTEVGRRGADYGAGT